MRIPARNRLLASAAVAALIGASATGLACGGSKSKEPAQKPTSARFDPANFGNPARGANPYLPLRPGTQWVREGTTRVGGRKVPHQVTTTVTDVYRTINGVRTVAVLDHELDSGQVSQESLDYLAEDEARQPLVPRRLHRAVRGRALRVGARRLAQWREGRQGRDARAGRAEGRHPALPGRPARRRGGRRGPGDQGRRPALRAVQLLRRRAGGARGQGLGARQRVQVLRPRRRPDRQRAARRQRAQGRRAADQPDASSVRRRCAEVSAEALRLDHHAVKTAPSVFGRLPIGKRG